MVSFHIKVTSYAKASKSFSLLLFCNSISQTLRRYCLNSTSSCIACLVIMFCNLDEDIGDMGGSAAQLGTIPLFFARRENICLICQYISVNPVKKAHAIVVIKDRDSFSN